MHQIKSREHNWRKVCCDGVNLTPFLKDLHYILPSRWRKTNIMLYNVTGWIFMWCQREKESSERDRIAKIWQIAIFPFHYQSKKRAFIVAIDIVIINYLCRWAHREQMWGTFWRPRSGEFHGEDLRWIHGAEEMIPFQVDHCLKLDHESPRRSNKKKTIIKTNYRPYERKPLIN